jgi:hypothetical protein
MPFKTKISSVTFMNLLIGTLWHEIYFRTGDYYVPAAAVCTNLSSSCSSFRNMILELHTPTLFSRTHLWIST